MKSAADGHGVVTQTNYRGNFHVAMSEVMEERKLAA
jgi:hypothetical protein